MTGLVPQLESSALMRTTRRQGLSSQCLVWRRSVYTSAACLKFRGVSSGHRVSEWCLVWRPVYTSPVCLHSLNVSSADRLWSVWVGAQASRKRHHQSAFPAAPWHRRRVSASAWSWLGAPYLRQVEAPPRRLLVWWRHRRL